MGIADQLSTHFQGASKKDWETVAKSETEQANANDSLTWTTQDNLQFAAYYDRGDLNTITHHQKFDFPDTSDEFSTARDWKNLPLIAFTDEKQANTQALDHLKHEADGILFSWTKPSINFQVLLNKIEWPHCYVSFLVPDEFSAMPLSVYIQEKKYSQLNGAIFQRSPLLND